MARFETYQSNAAETPVMRKWIISALIISLLLHGALLAFFQMKKLENFGNENVERLAPPVHPMKRVSLPPMPEEARVIAPPKLPAVTKFAVPEDKPQVQEIHVAPQLPELTKAVASEKPKADFSASDALASIDANSRRSMERELNSLAGSLLERGPRSVRQPVIVVPTGSKPGEGGAADGAGIPGRLSLDDALAKTGLLSSSDKPIGVPGGALYEYDSAELKDAAIEQLRKLGELIQRNPNATFSIEGHTDSTGTEAYNLELSRRRAESVKNWLVANMNIAPARIQTRGLGNTKLIVPAEKTVEEQQPNRRVEIVIKTNRK